MDIRSIVLTILGWVFWLPRVILFDTFVEIATTRFRWVIIIPIVLPMSLVYYFITNMRNRISFYLRSAPNAHETKVSAISERVKARAELPEPRPRMCTARSSWSTMSIFHGKYKSKSYQVDLSSLVDVLEVDTERQVVRVEPLVTCGQITETLLPLGWTLEVLPELDDLTVGGLVSGFGIETSSHKYGLFQHICESFEIVLANGDVVVATKDSHPDLFYNFPWAHGTLGFLLSVELRIIPAKKYVKLEHYPYYSLDEFQEAFVDASNDTTNDFVEALGYDIDRYVLSIGHLTDHCEPGRVHAIGRWYGPWWYKHVEQYLEDDERPDCDFVEYIPLAHYNHRHTRSLFWEMEDIVWFGHYWLFRVLLGWLLPPKVSFLKLTTTAKLHELYKKKHVDQDFLLPIDSVPETLEKLHKELNMYPLWFCPCRIKRTPISGLVNPDNDSDDEMYVDLGVYGVPFYAKPEGGETFEAKKSGRKIEKFIRKVNGYQALYAITYQTRGEFRRMFSHTAYDKVRKKYKCEDAFPQIYDKVSLEARGEA